MTDKEIESHVYSREEMYRIVAENTMDTIVLVDRDSVVRYVSPSIFDLCGYTVDEYEGMDAFDVIVPDDRERIRGSLVEALATRKPVDVDYRGLHADGRIVHLETRVKPVLDAEDRVKYVVAVVRDVTRRKQTEQLLENILSNVNATVWSTDNHFTRYHYFAGDMESVMGIPKEEAIERPIRLHDHIHPEDNESLMGEVKNKLDSGIPVRKEFRLIHNPDETRWGALIIHPQLDGNGNVERLDGITLDITDKKRVELELEESEQRYKSLFEHNLDSVFSIGLKELHLVNANKAFEQTTGIQLSQLADRCFIGLIHDEDHPDVFKTLLEVMQQGEPRDIECRLATMDPGERIVSITFVPIFLSGSLNGIHGILKDITKRKQEERELIQREERTKYLQNSLNRLSSDLANVMKVSELEARLIHEVTSVLPTSGVLIEEEGQPVNETPGTIRIRIGEKPHPVFLSMHLEQPLVKMEEEWLETAVHYVRILYDNLHRTEDLMKRLEEWVGTKETPKWMLRLIFRLSEKERAALSSDLHDSVLQDLIIWYRKLESLRSANLFGENAQAELVQIENGLLDAIHQIRITCNELRPPFLLKMGLVESLKRLFEYARMFANYEIEFHAEQLDLSLHEDQILGVYRIVQELLNNASKHSKATRVVMSLESDREDIHFRYSDDGVGLDLTSLEGSYEHMGITGIKKRVLSLEGHMHVESAPNKGFQVTVTFPKQTMER